MIRTKYPNLRAEAARKGYSRADIAAAAGVGAMAYDKWQRGDSTLKLEQAAAIKEKLFPELTIDYLFKPQK